MGCRAGTGDAGGRLRHGQHADGNGRVCRRTWTAKIERPLFRDAVLTVTDPVSGEAFTGKLPGSGPTVSTGNAPPPDQVTAFALLVGDRGGALTCQVALESWSGSGLCSDAAGRSIYLAF